MLILCLASLLKMFISSRESPSIVYGTSYMPIMLSVSRGSLSLCLYSSYFFLFYCSKTSHAIFKKNELCRHPCLSADFSGNTFSLLSTELSYTFMAFFMLRYVPVTPRFFSGF